MYTILLFIFHTIQFNIRHYYDNKYICDMSNGEYGSEVSVCDSKNKMEIQVFHDNDGYITIREESTKSVLTVNNNILTISEYRGVISQKFMFVMIEPNMFIIKHRNYCIEFIPYKMKYEVVDCTASGYQLFSIINNVRHKKHKHHNEITPLYMDEDTTYRVKCMEGVNCMSVYNGTSKS